MSRIRSRDTRPEMSVRSGLHRRGLRFRLRDKRLPGSPDLVLKRLATVVFVHGCFWHSHRKCRQGKLPKSNKPYWSRKLARNVQRDQETTRRLRKLGWRVIVVWECRLLPKSRCDRTLDRLAREIRQGETREKRY